MKSNNINTMKRGSRSVVSTTLATASIQHPFGIHSACIGTGRKAGGKLLRLAAMVCLLFVLGVGNAFGTAPTLEDLSFATPIVDENFNSLSTVSNNATSAVSKTDWTAYGVLNCIYNNNTGNTYQISSTTATTGFSSNCLYLSVNSSKNSGTIMHITTETWGTKGAFRVKTTKTSRGHMGLYGETSGTAITNAKSSVYVRNLSGTVTINDGSGTWQTVGTYSTDIIDICVIYNNTNSGASYGNSISLGAKTAHMYINGTAVMNAAGTAPKNFTIPGASLTSFRLASNFTTNNKAAYDDLQIWNALPTAAVSCSNTVTLSKGSESHGTLTLGSTSITTCNATASTRQVTITVAPNTGYATPSTLSWTKSSGTVTATKVSGPTGSSSPYSYVYQFDQDDSGSGTFGVTCTAKNYTVTLNDGAGSGGSGSVTVTYNSNTNLTSAVTIPTRTGYDFTGYKTSALTTLIDEDGNWLASKTGYTDASKNWIYADDVTLNAYWTVKNYSVTWKVNNTTYTDGSPSDNVNHGSRVAKLPTNPDPDDYCGDKFIGWTDATDGAYVHGTSTLFTTAGTAPVASGAQIFYAVFADYTTE